MTKSSAITIPQISFNEVTSTDHLSTTKRQRTVPLSMNTTLMTFRSPFPSSATASSTLTTTTAVTTSSNTTNAGSEEQRKKQIRDSNREAARRCRERRRQYIEQLEEDLEQQKTQIKALGEKVARIERENTQLRAILSEAKVLRHPRDVSADEAHIDYSSAVLLPDLGLNSESRCQIDGRTIH